DDAILIYRQALVLRPDDAQAHNDLGELHAQRGELGQAIAAYREALRADPQFDNARMNLERALREAGRPVENVNGRR
ncbi:MAG: tetratricopeptide repeat protein, partial [Myxococcota bacterium]